MYCEERTLIETVSHAGQGTLTLLVTLEYIGALMGESRGGAASANIGIDAATLRG
ncbi:hypothetical protein LCGC14_1690720 [marine sediment metagenome]|uniref:Uncharacterized protein n=1 Tax=marine sediment metagenome TaxID=412755 RepID=A0A0F9KKX9_9ZZZZ